ncbi:MAG: ATP phosphoribosyltransferase regulatory subunit, partial [Eubacterium sp.]|nr:ATP phosphoribosyltransferase regulatory subunit [Eubacterium sp.]
IEAARSLADGEYGVEFELTLVRGQGYYTGIVFEVISDEFGGTVAGGGRYDGLIGRFSGKDVPAVGFSIGFERIYSVLSERGVKAGERSRAAVLYEEGCFPAAYRRSRALLGDHHVTLFPIGKKLGKQLSRLEQQGFAKAVIYRGEDEEVKDLGAREKE